MKRTTTEGASNLRARSPGARAKRRTTLDFHARLVRRGNAFRLQVQSRKGMGPSALAGLTFAQGSQLFTAVLAALEKADLLDATAPGLPSSGRWDPLAILSGRQPLPWRLRNPAGHECVRCWQECIAQEGGGYICYCVCMCVPC